jgi:hypothetical protein
MFIAADACACRCTWDNRIQKPLPRADLALLGPKNHVRCDLSIVCLQRILVYTALPPDAGPLIFMEGAGDQRWKVARAIPLQGAKHGELGMDAFLYVSAFLNS